MTQPSKLRVFIFEEQQATVTSFVEECEKQFIDLLIEKRNENDRFTMVLSERVKGTMNKIFGKQGVCASFGSQDDEFSLLDKMLQEHPDELCFQDLLCMFAFGFLTNKIQATHYRPMLKKQTIFIIYDHLQDCGVVFEFKMPFIWVLKHKKFIEDYIHKHCFGKKEEDTTTTPA